MRSKALIWLVIGLFLAMVLGTGAYDSGDQLKGTSVGGILVGNNVWNLAGSPYWMESDILIPNGSNLTIEAGISVLVNGDYAFESHGNLTILGTKDLSVSFSPNSSTVPSWGGIWIRANQFSATGLNITNGTLKVYNVTDPQLDGAIIKGLPNEITLDVSDVENFVIRNITVIHPGGNGDGIQTFKAPKFTLIGFNVSGPSGTAGIQVGKSNNCTISNGHISSFMSHGLILNVVNDSLISNLTILDANLGIQLVGHRNIFESNIFYPESSGISIQGSDNVIRDNIIQNPTFRGISVVGVNYPGSGNLIVGNSIVGAGWFGICFDIGGPETSDSNTAAYNTIVESGSAGIFFQSSFNKAYGNLIVGNSVGVRVKDSSSSNRIFHNHFIDNVQQALVPGTGNEWDDGYPSGGNWWSDYIGVDDCSGPLQDNCPDPDGIGDTPYYIDLDSRDHYPFYFTPLPLPPRHVTAMADSPLGNVVLEWEPPPLLPVGQYLIYTASTPTGFNFSNPTATVDVPVTSWTDFGATLQPGPKYYVVRALNLTSSKMSSTSNTAGKWTVNFQSGLQTFSPPLIPYPWVDYSKSEWDDTVEDSLEGLGATSVGYMEAGAWVSVPGPGDPNRPLAVGEGYVARLPAPIPYTFVGLPGSMIKYKDSPPLPYKGFGLDGARLIWASSLSGFDVKLSWVQPSGITPMQDIYRIYYSTKPDGFFGLEGHDYFLRSNFSAPSTPVAEITYLSDLAIENELYYMVVPYINSSLEGSGSYSIGIFGADLASGYSAISLPLRPYENGTYLALDVSTLSNANILGVQWLDANRQDWVGHQAWMPPGMYDTPFVMVMTVQVDTSAPTRIVFTGV